MGKAFQCCLCGELEAGEPVAKVTVSGVNANEEWCTGCLASYQDWRAAMKPQMDAPPDAPEDPPPYTSSYA